MILSVPLVSRPRVSLPRSQLQCHHQSWSRHFFLNYSSSNSITSCDLKGSAHRRTYYFNKFARKCENTSQRLKIHPSLIPHAPFHNQPEHQAWGWVWWASLCNLKECVFEEYLTISCSEILQWGLSLARRIYEDPGITLQNCWVRVLYRLVSGAARW